MHQWISGYFGRHKTAALLTAYALILVIGFLDYVTGYRLGFSIFYLIPISLVVWHLGLRPGIIISAVGTIVWIIADKESRGANAVMLVVLWNAAVRMGFFITVTVVLANLRLSLERETVLARTDYLTGIANNQAFMEILHGELERLQRYRRPLTLAYLDCDQFKTVNDSFGHEAGNRLLKKIADVMLKTKRAIDKVGRLGGDEFLILLPETDSGAAKTVLVRLKDNLLKEMQENKWNVTFSIGAATFSAPLKTISEMISHADHLMYCAKKEGKNRIVYQTFSERMSV